MRRSHHLFSLALALGLAASAAAQAPDVVRVRILDRQAPRTVTVTSEGPLYVAVDGIESGAALHGTAMHLTAYGRHARAEFAGADLSGTELRLTGDGLRVRAGDVDRTYLGAIVAHVEDGELRVVNHTPVEPYVASVVASEFGFDVLEGAKAQAVLARTYAARRAGHHPRHDLDDHTGSQVFHGVDAATPVSTQAAQETAGEVLTYRGALADAFYFSSSGGHTADNDAVWNGAPLPYLRGVPDPYDTAAPDHTWRTTARRGAVLRALSNVAGHPVTGFLTDGRSRSGRVLRVELLGGRGTTISGNRFRQVVNGAVGGRTVRSTRFEVERQGDQYVFTGGGFGHGVGLSQFGALGQARDGRDYREILAHYFQGTAVAGTAPIAARAPAATRPAHTAAPATADRGSALEDRYRPASPRRRPTPRAQARAEADASTPAPRRKAW